MSANWRATPTRHPLDSAIDPALQAKLLEYQETQAQISLDPGISFSQNATLHDIESMPDAPSQTPIAMRQSPTDFRRERATEDVSKGNKTPQTPPESVEPLDKLRPSRKTQDEKQPHNVYADFINPLDILLTPGDRERMAQARKMRERKRTLKLDPDVINPPCRVIPDWFKADMANFPSNPFEEQLRQQFGDNFGVPNDGVDDNSGPEIVVFPDPDTFKQGYFSPNFNLAPTSEVTNMGFNPTEAQSSREAGLFNLFDSSLGVFGATHTAAPSVEPSTNPQSSSNHEIQAKSHINEDKASADTKFEPQAKVSGSPAFNNIASAEEEVSVQPGTVEPEGTMEIDTDFSSMLLSKIPNDGNIVREVSSELGNNPNTGRNIVYNLKVSTDQDVGVADTKVQENPTRPESKAAAEAGAGLKRDEEGNNHSIMANRTDKFDTLFASCFSELKGEGSGSKLAEKDISVSTTASLIQLAATSSAPPTESIQATPEIDDRMDTNSDSAIAFESASQNPHPIQPMSSNVEFTSAHPHTNMNIDPVRSAESSPDYSKMSGGLPTGYKTSIGFNPNLTPHPSTYVARDIDGSQTFNFGIPFNGTNNPTIFQSFQSTKGFQSPEPRFPVHGKGNAGDTIRLSPSEQLLKDFRDQNPGLFRNGKNPFAPSSAPTSTPLKPSAIPQVPGLGYVAPPTMPRHLSSTVDYIGDVPPELAEFVPEKISIPWTVYDSDYVRKLRREVMGQSQLEADIPFPEQWTGFGARRRVSTGEVMRALARGSSRGRFTRGRVMGRGRGGGIDLRDAAVEVASLRDGQARGVNVRESIQRGPGAKEGASGDSVMGNAANDTSTTTYSNQDYKLAPVQTQIKPSNLNRPKLVPRGIKRTMDPAAVPLPSPGPDEDNMDLVTDKSENVEVHDDGNDDGGESSEERSDAVMESDEESDVMIDSDEDKNGTRRKYAIEIDSDTESGEDEEEEQSEDSSPEDEINDNRKTEANRRGRKGSSKLYFNSIDEYLKAFPLDPEFEARMLKHSQPFIDKCIAEHEANVAAEEARKKRIAELSKPPKFIGPAPQLQIGGQNKRVSLLDVNGGKPANNNPAPIPAPLPPVKLPPKRVSFRDINTGGSLAAAPQNGEGSKEEKPLPVVTKSPLFGFRSSSKRAPPPKKLQTKPPQEFAGKGATPPPISPQEEDIIPTTFKKGRISTLTLQAKKPQNRENTTKGSPRTQKGAQEMTVNARKSQSQAGTTAIQRIDEVVAFDDEPKATGGKEPMKID